MKPIKLEIEGLQSFSTKQIIDFKELTSLGLFGIFGETGSGKSTILDAMILAIYGVVPRTMGKQDSGVRQCLNYNSDKIKVVFDFFLGDKEFSITREYKRKFSRKGEEKFETANPLLIINGEVVADTVKNVASVINNHFGINVDDFTRSVVLPQGKFSDFLKLKSADRVEMLENIFELEKYGTELQNKMKIKHEEVKDNISALDNQIKGKGDISLESLEALKVEKIEKDREFQEISLEKEKSKNELDELDQISELFNDLEVYTSKVESLENKRESIDELIKKVADHELAIKYQEKIERILSLRKEIGKLELSLKSSEDLKDQLIKNEVIIKDEKSNLENDILKINENLKEISIDYTHLDSVRVMVQVGKEIEFKKDTLSQKENELKEVFEHIIADKESLKEFEEKLALTKNKLNSLEIIDESKRDSLNVQVSNISKDIDANERNIVQLESLNKKLKEIEICKESITSQMETISNEIKENYLKELSKDLKENCPCPLCGSKDHPITKDEHIFQEGDSITNLQEKKDSLDNELNKINSELYRTKGSIELIGEISSTEDLKNLLENKKEELSQLEKKYKLITQERKEYEGDILKFSQHIEFNKNSIDKNEIKTSNLNSSIETLKDEISSLKIENNLDENYNLEDIITEKNQLEEREKKQRVILQEKSTLEKKLENYNMELLRIENKILLEEQSIKSAKEQIPKVLEEISVKDKELSLDARENGFEDVYNAMDKVLNPSILESTKLSIKDFEENMIKYTSLKSECLKKIDNRIYDREKHELLKNRYFEIKIEEKKIYETLSTLNTKIELLEKAIKDVEEILKKKEIYNKELDNILLLRETFKGKKFVKFLARKKLDYVVYQASKRLRKITRGRYTLGINNSCDFNIIDSFNSNSVREASTLSGGETFIVSLVLALALSSQLQLKGSVNLEFFFLDEGFGTLDSDLLDRVISTLEDIKNKEKISIGIISHVEDLKIRIPRRLEVSSAVPGERGSLIKLI